MRTPVRVETLNQYNTLDLVETDGSDLKVMHHMDAIKKSINTF